MSVRPAKTQISLSIRPVWSATSLCAQWVANDLSFLYADSKDSDQTGRMPRLIWVFAGRTLILLVLTCRGSNVFVLLASLFIALHEELYLIIWLNICPNDFAHCDLNNQNSASESYKQNVTTGFMLRTKPQRDQDQRSRGLAGPLGVSAGFDYLLFAISIKIVLEDQLLQKSATPAQKSLVADQRIGS